MYQRRNFLKLAGAAGCSLAVNSVFGSGAFAQERAVQPFGLQLYTLREDMPKDPKGILKQVASYGYKQIESFEGQKGIFWGMKNTEFKKYMDDLGMTIISSHCNIDKDFEQKAAEASAIGMKYLIAPYLGPQKSLDDYKKAADKFNNRGEICKKAGLRFAYHNHDYTFVPVNGEYPQDVLMKNTDKSLVDYEMDIYWVVTAGQDPLQWFDKHPGRFTLTHVKDRKKGASATEKEASVVVGTGGINFKNILKKGKEKGVVYNIIEQERYDNTTPLMAAQKDAAYMKNLKM